MHRRDQRAFPSVEPPGAPVGKEVVDVDDVGAELFQLSERRGSTPVATVRADLSLYPLLDSSVSV